LYLGSLVDKWLGTRGPWFTLLGLLVGMISGFTLLLRMLKKSGEDRGD